jgi:hypothetical protein
MRVDRRRAAPVSDAGRLDIGTTADSTTALTDA